MQDKIQKAFEGMIKHCTYHSNNKPECCANCDFAKTGASICYFLDQLRESIHKDCIITALSKFIAEDTK